MKYEKTYEKYGIRIPDINNDYTVLDLIKESAQKYSKSPLFVYEGKQYYRGDVLETAAKLASYLIDIGIKPNDRVGVALPNIPQTIITYYAIWMVGATIVAMNPLYTSRELQEQITLTHTKLVVILDIFATKVTDMSIPVIITHMRTTLSLTKKIFSVFYGKKIHRNIKGPFIYEWAHLKKYAPLTKTYDNPDQIATILFSGGTTGISKAVLTSHKKIVNSLRITDGVYHAIRTHIFNKTYLQSKVPYDLIGVPLFHVYGFVMAHLYMTLNSATNILVAVPVASQIIKALKKYNSCSVVMHLVPEQYEKIIKYCKNNKLKLRNVMLMISTAGKLKQTTYDEMYELTNAKIAEAYGMTEAAPISLHPYPQDDSKQNSVGIIAPHVSVKIVDVNDLTNELQPGKYGEILIQGPHILDGYNYENNPEGFYDGWFATGDCGYVDNEGWLYLAGRKKEMVNVKGFKVYAPEIESILVNHPKVLEGCMIGKFSPLGHCGAYTPDANDEVVTLVVVKKDDSLTKEELIEYFRERVAPYKVPREVIFIEKLPRDTLGKIKKTELKQL